MHSTLSKLWETRAKRAKGDEGFTLIELLVVVVILGVLIAVAIPLYLNYRKSANDAATQSDVRNAISIMEVCYSDSSPQAYPTAIPLAPPGGAPTGCPNQSITLSNGTALLYFLKTGAVGYVISGSNTNGTAGKNYCYDSTAGGSVQSGAKKATAAGCA